MPKYSIVIPLHNEQDNVTDLYDRLKAVMESAGESFEIVFVDDGSGDDTFHLLRRPMLPLHLRQPTNCLPTHRLAGGCQKGPT